MVGGSADWGPGAQPSHCRWSTSPGRQLTGGIPLSSLLGVGWPEHPKKATSGLLWSHTPTPGDGTWHAQFPWEA